MRVNNDDLILSGTDMSLDITSEPIWVGHVINYSIQLVFSGASPTGAFKLQMSLDEGQPQNPVEANRDTGITNWTDIAGSEQAIAAAGNHAWTAENAGYQWVRVVWTKGTSVGTIDSARFYTKGF